VSRLPPRARLGVVAAAVVLVVAAAVYLLFLRGGDEGPVSQAGSRFGSEQERGGGGTLLDTLAPVLDAGQAKSPRGGSDPAPPSEDEIERSPGHAVAGLFLVGFPGKETSASFFVRLGARPYGGVLLTRTNYTEPSQLSALTAKIQSTARDAGHPAPLVAAAQEGGEFSAFPNLAPSPQVDIGRRKTATIKKSAHAAGEQLKALGIGMNLAPNADIAVAGGPGQGRAYADSAAKVTTAVKAAVAGYRQAGVVATVGPFPGDGGASQDPSIGPAPVGLGIDELRNGDMAPFTAVVKGGGDGIAIQMSNAIYVAFDSVTPATLSAAAVKELRDRLGFKGAIVSANLVATTATTGGSVGEAAVDALEAGMDLLLVPGGRAQQDEAHRAVVSALRSGEIPASRVVSALGHIADLRRATRATREPLRPQ
jgi:beta-N-acetylhexosaminidase